jgi:hypothetical protein
MLITPINLKNSQQTSSATKDKNTNFKAATTAEIINRNKFLIAINLGMKESNPWVLMPKSGLEKELVLKTLDMRSRLDKFYRLTKELFESQMNRFFYEAYTAENIQDSEMAKFKESLVQKGEWNSFIDDLKMSLDKKGNWNSYINNLKDRIKLEENKQKEAIEYFKEIDNLETRYLEEKKITEGKLGKEYANIQKNKLYNKAEDRYYTAKELIEIINGDKVSEAQKSVNIKYLNKDQLLDLIEHDYEALIKENVDIYNNKTNFHQIYRNARKVVLEKYMEGLKRHSGMDKYLEKSFYFIERKYQHKLEIVTKDTQLHPVNEIWKAMRLMEEEMRNTINKIEELHESLIENPENESLLTEIKSKKATLNELKSKWIDVLEYGLYYENTNRNILEEKGCFEEYSYLMENNKVLNKYIKIYEKFIDNGHIMPEETWDDVMKPIK